MSFSIARPRGERARQSVNNERKAIMSETKREWTFDGCGVNGADAHRARLATLTSAGQQVGAGPVMATAPELLEALEGVMGWWRGTPAFSEGEDEMPAPIFDAAMAAIAKGKGAPARSGAQMYARKAADGLFELRQTRFKEQLSRGQSHPWDVCAVARSVEELKKMCDPHWPGADYSQLKKGGAK